MDKAEIDTEIIAILDGYWPDPPIKDRKNVTFIHHTESIGQRAAVNEGVRLSQAKYIMKLDAHCAVDKGFDRKLMADCEPDWTVIPRMYNLHVFNYVCKCGEKFYQSPHPETCQCGSKEFKREIIWKRRKVKTDFWRFDNNMKFQYWTKYKERPESKGDITDVMSSIGACFFMERKRFWEIDGVDEKHGSWGQFGTEIACKSWLSGGRHVVNKKTWFGHMFRTNKTFSFPYPIEYSAQEKAREYSQKLWLGNNWPKQIHKLEWLIDKFNPPDWDTMNQSPLLSILIPARNEKYLQATIDDILKNFTTNFEIIVGLDNCDSSLKENGRLRIDRSDARIGMRPMINRLAKQARGRYIMKTDAHCSFAKGYDQDLINIHKKGYTVLGIRYELNVDKWERKERTNCDFRYLSDPSDELGGLRGLAWHEYKKRTKGQNVAESMSLSGSGWLMEKAQFDSWDGLDEQYGTMYQEGAEIACKTWLSGGKLLINRKTWYAHHNRGRAPYALSTSHRQKSIGRSLDIWLNDKWPLQKYSFNWLLERFAPVPGWNDSVIQIRAKNQGTAFKGSRVKYRDEFKDESLDKIWEHRTGYSEPLKRWRLKIFFDSFLEVIEQVKTGKKFTEKEKLESRYFNYLVTHLAKEVLPQDKKEYVKKWKRHLLKKFDSGINLFKSIEKNGLYAPLEFYRKDDRVYLWKGYRRLVILKALGYKEVPVVTFIDERLKALPGRFPTPAKNSIDDIARKQFVKYGGKSTDKYWCHRYTPIYDRLFSHLRKKKVNILELGVARGASLLLWHECFPRAMIYGLDKNPELWKEMAEDLDRIQMWIGKQQDETLLKEVSKIKYDIIIDDCGHNPGHQFLSFKNLWEAVKPSGFYVIEDTYVSYLARNNGKINVVKEMASWTDALYTDYSVASLHFEHNICIVQKGID